MNLQLFKKKTFLLAVLGIAILTSAGVVFWFSFTAKPTKSEVATISSIVITNKELIKAIEQKLELSFVKNANGDVVVDDNRTIIDNITILDISAMDLKSIDGIGNFTNLKNLDCSQNQLTLLDVSKLTQLRSLNCANNQLTTVYVPNLTYLEELNCSANQLTELYMSSSSPLKILDCSSNRLTTLDVSKFTQLEELNYDDNPDIKLKKRTEPNVIINKRLIELIEQKLNLEFDKNARGEVLLTDCLYIIDTITVLDLSGKQLDSLNGIEHFKLLKQLDCSNNNLTTLDVSSLEWLQMLNCANNQLKTLDVSNLTRLNELNYDGNPEIKLKKTAEAGVINNKKLIEAIERNTGITFDKNSDGHVVVADNREAIESVTALYLSQNNLLSLAGIEYFTNLEKLDCSINWLTSLDVSKLTKLTELYCGAVSSSEISFNQFDMAWLHGDYEDENIHCNKLSELDVSMLTKLKYLDCSKNELTTLDVSKLTQLEYLGCNLNNLDSLDVSNLKKLLKLDCCWNNITTLDVSMLTQLQNLNCRENKLDTLDVSKCTQLESLDCGKNKLNMLNVSNLKKLEGLFCYSCNLTSLDVSGLTNLMYFSIINNQLTKLDVSKCTQLKSLDCSQNNLTTLDISKLTQLTYLESLMNPLTKIGVHSIEQAEKLEYRGEIEVKQIEQ